MYFIAIWKVYFFFIPTGIVFLSVTGQKKMAPMVRIAALRLQFSFFFIERVFSVTMMPILWKTRELF